MNVHKQVRKLAFASAMLTVGVLFAACPHNVTPENPAAAAAIKADAVVIRVNELQAVVIQACGPGPECQPNSLPTNAAREIVKACIDLRSLLKPPLATDWRTLVKNAWALKKPSISSNDPIIQSAIAGVDTIIGGL